eukprot:TRINITY_DN2797_c0_g1_i2.p1 TRINITY_DN2797_c0_g1~~TRINITY_DN2797_c0_g1_i2.p1  ORF type:complete len:1272 (-),score=416.47 TRINITY_DN2797_c0_g1_i2:106-3921(-)
MGSTGAGKTTLLNALAQRSEGIVGGDVTMNGEPLPARFNKVAGYVMQEDKMYANLTVRETLTNRALLCLPPSMSREEKLHRVEDVIDVLNLTNRADQMVGDEMRRGLSGSEKKLLAIGEVLITNPALIFLDEPTTGLDSATSLVVMDTLRMLASAGRTIVCTIHQPRSSIFAKCDKLMLLAGGEVVYFGLARKSVEYFGSLKPVPFHCPRDSNPADFVLDLTTLVGREDRALAQQRIAYLIERYKEQPQLPPPAAIAPELAQETRKIISQQMMWQTNWFQQYAILTRRSFFNFVRNPTQTIAHLVSTIIMSLLIGLIFLRMGYGQSDVQNRIGGMFMLLIFGGFQTMADNLQTFPHEKVLVMRERSAGVFRISAYQLGKITAELPFAVLWVVLQTVIAYWMGNLNAAADRFFIFIGFVVLLALASGGHGLLMSALAPNGEVAQIVGPIAYVFLMLFAGFFVNVATLPQFLAWIKYVSFIRYAFEVGMVNEFSGTTFTCTPSQQIMGVCPVSTGDQVLQGQLLTNINFGHNAAILTGFVVAYQILIYLSLRFVARPEFKRHQGKKQIPPAESELVEKKTAVDVDLEVIARLASNMNVKPTTAMLLDKVEPMTLTWNNITYTVDTGKQGKLNVLTDVSGSARPGEIVCVIGPSGCGKTSLLNVLSRRAQGVVRGELLLNGKEVGDRIPNAGYVEHDIHQFATLTVRETLINHALLRLPASVPREEKLAKVEQIIAELGLIGCANTRVGSEELGRGLSGGERRRLCIGEILITNPSILFLDEPTSGLDAATSLSVMDTLRMLASAGRTIITTIHQPRSDIYAKFDKLILLAEGFPVYTGPANTAINYFESLEPVSYPCPPYTNAADFLVDLTSPIGDQEGGKDGTQRIEYLKERHRMRAPSSIIHSRAEHVTEVPVEHQNSWLTMFSVLLVRAWRNLIRQSTGTIARGVQSVVMGVLIGLIYLRQPSNQVGISNRVGVLFFFLMFQTANMNTVLHAFPSEKNIIIRDRAAGAYKMSSYIMARYIAELPFELIFPALFAIICYWMVGLKLEAGAFFIFLVTLVLMNMCATGLGMTISAASPNTAIASMVAPLMMMLLTVFGGLFLNDDSTPYYFYPFKYISFARYAYQAVLANEFRGQTFTCEDAVGACVTTGEAQLVKLNFSWVNIGESVGVLVAMVVAWRILAYIFLRGCAKVRYNNKLEAAVPETGIEMTELQSAGGQKIVVLSTLQAASEASAVAGKQDTVLEDVDAEETTAGRASPELAAPITPSNITVS